MTTVFANIPFLKISHLVTEDGTLVRVKPHIVEANYDFSNFCYIQLLLEKTEFEKLIRRDDEQ